jgi:hypothetical protein
MKRLRIEQRVSKYLERSVIDSDELIKREISKKIADSILENFELAELDDDSGDNKVYSIDLLIGDFSKMMNLLKNKHNAQVVRLEYEEIN